MTATGEKLPVYGGHIGADPEGFIFDKEGHAVPAHTFFPPKTAPLAFYSDLSGSIYYDGFAVEINTAPTHCRAHVANTIREAIRVIKRRVPKGHTFKFVPVVTLHSLSILRGAPPEVLEWGCDPAMNAYTGAADRPDINPLTHMKRYAGGHLHFELNRRPSVKEACVLTKKFDAYVGLPLTYMLGDQDAAERRRVYGKAGEFRIQNYSENIWGLEYRTPGPEIFNNALLLGFAFSTGRSILTDPAAWPSLIPQDQAVVRKMINSAVTDSAFINRVANGGNKAFAAVRKDQRWFKSLTIDRCTIDYHTGWGDWISAGCPTGVNKQYQYPWTVGREEQ